MFRTVPMSTIKCFSLYTQQWYMPHCPKHVEFYSKNKLQKLVHLVGFIIKTKTVLSPSTVLLMCGFHNKQPLLPHDRLVFPARSTVMPEVRKELYITHLFIQNVQNPHRAIDVYDCKYTKIRRGLLKYPQRVINS